MTLDTYTLGTFAAGALAGIALMLLGRATADQVFIIRYLRRHYRPESERRRATGTSHGWPSRARK